MWRYNDRNIMLLLVDVSGIKAKYDKISSFTYSLSTANIQQYIEYLGITHSSYISFKR